MKPFIHPKALVETAKIGGGTRVWAFAHVMKGARVGRDCNIGDHAFIERGAVIGDRVTVKNGVSVWDRVRVENNVFLGPNAVFTNELLPRSRQSPKLAATRIREGACIGANAVIVCGHTVGRHAFVAAGAVVCANVPDYTLVMGNPARAAGFLCECRKKLEFKADSARCRCGRRYRTNRKGVITRS